MDKKKVPLTNEEIRKKFKSSFELVNYAIKLAENMINTGRDARVKSDVQNRALLILEEIQEGRDQFDEIKITSTSDLDINGINVHTAVYEERPEKRKHRVPEIVEGEV